MATSMSQARQKTERLMNVLVLLLGSPRGVTRAEVFAAFPRDYPDDTPATQKKFERDKEELRDIVPIEWEQVDGNDVYRIDADAVHESELKLTADEAAVVAVAVNQAFEGDAAREVRLATDALATAGGNTGHARSSLSISPLPSALQAFMRAFMTRRSVEFSYLKPDEDAPKRRSLDVWGILAHDGHWYIGGWDHARGDERVFRLDRVVSAVDLAGRAETRPVQGFDLRTKVLHEPTEPTAARVLVRKGRGQRLRQAARLTASGDGDWDVLTLDCRDIEATASLIARFGPDAIAQEPAAVRARVIAKLQSLEAAGIQ